MCTSGSTSARAPRPRWRCRSSAAIVRGIRVDGLVAAPQRRLAPRPTAGGRPGVRDDRHGRPRHRPRRGRRGRPLVLHAPGAATASWRTTPRERSGRGPGARRRRAPAGSVSPSSCSPTGGPRCSRTTDDGPVVRRGGPPAVRRARLPRRRGHCRPRSSSPCGWACRCCSRASPASARPPPPQVLAAALDVPLVRLQCYEGLTAARGALRLELPAPAARDPARRVAAASGSSEADLFSEEYLIERPILRCVRYDGPRAAGAADRRDRPCRRRVRGAAARGARRGVGDRARARHVHRRAAADRGADLQPQPRPARRAAPALPLPLAGVPRARPGSCAILRRTVPAANERPDRVGRPVRRPRARRWTWTSRRGWPRRSTGWPRCPRSAPPSWCARSSVPTLGRAGQDPRRPRPRRRVARDLRVRLTPWTPRPAAAAGAGRRRPRGAGGCLRRPAAARRSAGHPDGRWRRSREALDGRAARRRCTALLAGPADPGQPPARPGRVRPGLRGGLPRRGARRSTRTPAGRPPRPTRPRTSLAPMGGRRRRAATATGGLPWHTLPRTSPADDDDGAERGASPSCCRARWRGSPTPRSTTLDEAQLARARPWLEESAPRWPTRRSRRQRVHGRRVTGSRCARRSPPPGVPAGSPCELQRHHPVRRAPDRHAGLPTSASRCRPTPPPTCT